MNTLHITNGSCAKDIMLKAGIEGLIATWDDVLHEGPVPAGMEHLELSKIRAKYIIEQGWAPAEVVHHSFKQRDEALLSFRDYDLLLLWFEHDLYDQLQLIQILAWLALQDLEGVNIQLICEACYLGTLKPDEMLALQEKATRVSYEQLTIATTAWQSLILPNPSEWLNLLEQDTKCLPFLEGAIIRLLQEYPHCDSGLTLTQLQTLKSVLHEAKTPNEIFSAYQKQEERRFMGDTTFWGYLAHLINSDMPLIRSDAGQELSLSHTSSQKLYITDEGKKVLSGEKRWPGFLSIDRWIGGVHMTSANLWCWDESLRTLKSSKP